MRTILAWNTCICMKYETCKRTQYQNLRICLDLETSKAHSRRIKCSIAMQRAIDAHFLERHTGSPFHLRVQNHLINRSRIIKHINWLHKAMPLASMDLNRRNYWLTMPVIFASPICASWCKIGQNRAFLTIYYSPSHFAIVSQKANFLPWWTNKYFTCDNRIGLHFETLV